MTTTYDRLTDLESRVAQLERQFREVRWIMEELREAFKILPTKED